MRISDWSSDVCSSDLRGDALEQFRTFVVIQPAARQRLVRLAQTGDDIFAKRFALTGAFVNQIQHVRDPRRDAGRRTASAHGVERNFDKSAGCDRRVSRRSRRAARTGRTRPEEHTSELQQLMRISYAVFCSKKHK